MGSIRRRTLLLVLGLLGIALGGISFLGYRDARHEIQELFDARLAQQARLLAGMIPGGMAPDARAALQDALDAGAAEKDVDFYTGKVAAARFFARNVLPKIAAERAIAEATDNWLMDVPESAF